MIEDECTQCPGGYYCQVSGKSTVTDTCQGGTCTIDFRLTPKEGEIYSANPHGYYSDCSLFSVFVGFYCTSGVNVTAPHNNHTGIGGICPVGHECPRGSSTYKPCAPGYFASVEGKAACDLCPAGTKQCLRFKLDK